MKTYKEMSKPATYVFASEVTCDRCGRSAKVVGSTSHDAWGEFEALIQGTDDMVRLDLCQRCSDALIAWVGKHRKSHITRVSDLIRAQGEAMDEHDAAARRARAEARDA